MELTDLERAYVGQALFKRMAEEMSTKDPDNLRGRVDAQLREWYAATGARSYDANVHGRKVGTASVTLTKEVPAHVDEVVDLTDVRAFRAWVGDNPDEVCDYVAARFPDFCAWLADETGELPDGVTVTEVDVPAQPPRVKGTTMRIDPAKVADVLRDELPKGDGVVRLLEGGAE